MPTPLIAGCIPALTKRELLMNVAEKPLTRSTVFIERGKVSVFENPQRLGQINSRGELELHGYGFFNVKNQT